MQVLTFSSKHKKWLLKTMHPKSYLGLSMQNRLTVSRSSLSRVFAHIVTYPLTQERSASALIVTDSDGWKFNGLSPFSMHILKDKDEICFGKQSLYFTLQLSAEKRTYSKNGSQNAINCIRCKTLIEPGTSIISCPACSRIYHESSDLGCWSYDTKCLVCGEETSPTLNWLPN